MSPNQSSSVLRALIKCLDTNETIEPFLSSACFDYLNFIKSADKWENTSFEFNHWQRFCQIRRRKIVNELHVRRSSSTHVTRKFSFEFIVNLFSVENMSHRFDRSGNIDDCIRHANCRERNEIDWMRQQVDRITRTKGLLILSIALRRHETTRMVQSICLFALLWIAFVLSISRSNI